MYPRLVPHEYVDHDDFGLFCFLLKMPVFTRSRIIGVMDDSVFELAYL